MSAVNCSTVGTSGPFPEPFGQVLKCKWVVDLATDLADSPNICISSRQEIICSYSMILRGEIVRCTSVAMK